MIFSRKPIIWRRWCCCKRLEQSCSPVGYAGRTGSGVRYAQRALPGFHGRSGKSVSVARRFPGSARCMSGTSYARPTWLSIHMRISIVRRRVRSTHHIPACLWCVERTLTELSRLKLVASMGYPLKAGHLSRVRPTHQCPGALLDRQWCVGRTLQDCPALSW